MSAVPTSAPTLEDVARVAGVSRATVSRVVNGKRQVAPNIQEVVRRAVLDTGYVPNLAARSLVTRRTGTVAVVVSGAEDAAKGGASTSRTRSSAARSAAYSAHCDHTKSTRS